MARRKGPDVCRLRRFEKISLEPGEEKTLTFSLEPRDISFINARNARVSEAGEYDVFIQELTTSFTLK